MELESRFCPITTNIALLAELPKGPRNATSEIRVRRGEDGRTALRPLSLVVRPRCAPWKLAALFFLVTTVKVLAHDPGLSTAMVRLYPDRIEAVTSFSIVDTGEIVEVDKNHDGKFSSNEIAAACEELKHFQPEGIELKLDDQSVLASSIRCEFDASDNSSIFLTFPSKAFSKLVVRSKWLAMLQPGHRQFFTLQGSSGDVLSERMLSANSDTVAIQLDAPLAQVKPANSRKTSFSEFLLMGIRHIWTGYDHLLFLFGLLIVTRNFSSALKIITCFTVAHSITLALATLNLIAISSRIVEPMIAISIIYVGIENLARHGDPKGRWLLTFAFGLIHGFGFASVLRELGVGSNGSGITVPLVSFNLGVEIGQMAIAAIALPIIWKLREHPWFVRRCVPVCSLVVALLGSFWFVRRVWF
jgi:hydrogenase/urease accessory protein HupE